MRKKIAVAGAAIVALGLAGGGIAAAAGGGNGGPSRMDDGKQFASQAKVSEAGAIKAAQTRASGGLDEIDLEKAGGKLVYNVDVGSRDVKVDASSGEVVSVDADD